MLHKILLSSFALVALVMRDVSAYREVMAMRAASKKGAGHDTFRAMAPLYNPRTLNQELYVKYLSDPGVSILLGVGPAGTGKTLFACSQAVQEMKSGSIKKIILTRPVVSVEEEIGFLPGTLNDKMAPWTRPIFDILSEFYSKKDVDDMVACGAIEISPLAFMRGRTFKKAFVIADEMQNSSPNQMLMLTTRLGEGSRLVITGDLKQSDRAVDNGLKDLMQKLADYRGLRDAIQLVELGIQDVERSAAVSKILDIYEGNSVNTGTRSLPLPPVPSPSIPFYLGPNVSKVVGPEPINNDCALIVDDPYDRKKEKGKK